jgi:hypothetical protein
MASLMGSYLDRRARKAHLRRNPLVSLIQRSAHYDYRIISLSYRAAPLSSCVTARR